VVAFMTQALAPLPHERMLEIGTGSGYQTAVLALLAGEVYSIEIVPELAQMAAPRLRRHGHVHLRQGDGFTGWPEAAPFDGIILTAAPRRLPPTLVAQLAAGGRLVAPVGDGSDQQELVRVVREHDGSLHYERLLPVRFVPMTGLAEGLR
jgi:protein-L-isoaspartate(D-aspartate) O-methyltransferase